MYVSADTIVNIAALVTALGILAALAWKVIKWFQAQDKQTKDIEELRKKEAADIKNIEDELCVVSYAMLACLDGLTQLHCNGEVTKAHEKLQKHINRKAHDQI